MLETNMREQSLVAHRIMFEGVSKEDDMLKVYIRNKQLSNVKQSWSFAKVAETENKEHLTVCSYHVTYAFQSESTLYSCLNVKELLA